MIGASVIIPIYNGEAHLEETLESLVCQSVEDFEVILVDDGSTDGTAEICKKYCDEYVDFFYHRIEHAGVYAARNAGIAGARGEYLLFLDCGDLYAQDTIEGALKTGRELEADVLTGRSYRFGDIEYEYDSGLDELAVMPEIDRLAPGLVCSEEVGAKAFHRKLFDLHDLRFDETQPSHDELRFIVAACMKARRIAGCPDLIQEKRIAYVTEGFSQFEMPTSENLAALSKTQEALQGMGIREIIRRVGAVDGDEEFPQAVLFAVYSICIDSFYRRFWYMDEDGLALLQKTMEAMSATVEKSIVKRLVERGRDMRLPALYLTKEAAAQEPVFSILCDLRKKEEYPTFLRSLYTGSYPFFELLMKRSDYELLPEEFRGMENIRVFDDRTFHYEARKNTLGRCAFETKIGAPVDRRVLREVCMSRIPVFLVKRVFDMKRLQLGARKTLKDKGMVLKDRTDPV